MLPGQQPRVATIKRDYLLTRSFPLVYLGGPIKHTTWEGAVAWRDYATNYLFDFGIFTLDPMRGKDFLESHIKGTFGESFGDTTQSYKDFNDGWVTEHGITHRDIWDVRRCGIMLANFEDADRVSIGTVLEIGWASAWDKYIITVMDDTNPHWHGMVRNLSSLIVPDLNDALVRIPILLGAST